ncbi:MAG TPA: FKBP-type peptidyl-prolyl cis-trans isomerase [Thermoanaerobaculia bacterium]|nr:FKBP-type peptidyl-prolyl cis-trans isomerase [Thermoanaerobaculia bacterium]
MKKFPVVCILALLAVPAVAQTQNSQAPAQGQQRPKPESVDDRASYIIGLNLGRSLKQQEVPANPDLIIQGLRDGLGGGQALLTDEEIQAAMTSFQQTLISKQEAKRTAEGEKNQKESAAFLETNKKKEGVKTTASGLQYEVLQPGQGESPKPGDQVTVHYKGTLIDGTVFDSSYDRGAPVTFGVDQVIAGWTEALQLMKPGAKYKIYLPPSLAYGERGAGEEIGPNAALVFDVELLEIQKAGATPPPTTPPPAQPEKQ